VSAERMLVLSVRLIEERDFTHIEAIATET
jgi:hypothetical protein